MALKRTHQEQTGTKLLPPRTLAALCLAADVRTSLLLNYPRIKSRAAPVCLRFPWKITARLSAYGIYDARRVSTLSPRVLPGDDSGSYIPASPPLCLVSPLFPLNEFRNHRRAGPRNSPLFNLLRIHRDCKSLFFPLPTVGIINGVQKSYKRRIF